MGETGDATAAVSGELDAETAPRRLRDSEHWFDRGAETVIDLSGVTRVDSAGVALLLAWVRDARAAGASLRFVNAPAQMRAIIDFCALNDVIPVGEPLAATQPRG
ncbi:sulfate transporter [Salinisphaera orenii MK-B5]|uniref:Sulfate transporter n=1 Tax=Salinisphaera orenii MK-B5 TaxID=856730 RepID=A0A423PNN2_9GAMM|nr:STAS domain-containing protein [Salinisphaera orenii]ROO27141.1 sulfate transporter [Salinisphaera orenii MK-B5]